VFCDWQYTFSGAAGINTWVAVPLTDFSQWLAVLRRDSDASRSSHTFLKRAQVNFRWGLNDASYCTFNTFIVTLRKNATNRDPIAQPMVIDQDYIESNNTFAGANVRLNSDIFKVHYCKYSTLYANAYATQAIAAQTAGNPHTTFSKAQANILMNTSLTLPSFSAPGATSWRDKPFESLPYYQKFYVLVYLGSNPAETGHPFCAVDAQFVTVNSD